MPSGSNTNFHPQSGHPGVTWCSERRTWRICYAPEPGKRVTKSFNPRHYGGLEQALQAAIEYLREQKAKLSLFRPNGNSNKGESSNISIKKMNEKLADLHSNTNNVGSISQDLEINGGKCVNNNSNGGNGNNNSNWNNMQYNGFDYGSSLGSTEYNNGINSELLPGFENGKMSNKNLFGIENTNNEQWNVTAAAVIAHAITSSKANGFNQKRKANCEYSTSMRQPSNKAVKPNIYDDNNGNNGYLSQSTTTLVQPGNIEVNNGYCCECYNNRGTMNSCNNKNEDQNQIIDNNANVIGQNSFHYQCSQSTKSTISSSNNNNSNNNNNIVSNNINPFIYDYNDQNINEVMNIRTPKYVNYQRHAGSQNLEDDLLHPSIASSSPLGRVFQSTPYSNIDNYENILTPSMRQNSSYNHNHGVGVNNNGSNHNNNGMSSNHRYYGNIYENDVGIMTSNHKVSNNKNNYINGNSVMGCEGNINSGNGNYSCSNCINNININDNNNSNGLPPNEFNDYQSPFSTWFEGLGSCYSEIEDTFLNKSSQLLPVGSLGPYSFQPYKEQNNGSDINNKSIVESILLPLSTTSCSTSAEPQLSNELIIDSCQNVNLFQQNKGACLGDNSPININ